VAKVAGKVIPDPVTGQLTTSFEENPQVPIEDIDLKVFEGPRAALRTPPTCGSNSTLATFTPWSAPASGPAVELSDSFATTTAPAGSCPTSAAQLPNAPRLTARTTSSAAGSYSPFVLRVSREDDSQELKGLDITLPAGLTARLAGIPDCTEAQIAAARARSNPGEGALELANPSCPAASQVGTVAVTAGAGPSPYQTSGSLYLAGPYKGAPLSLVAIAPAVAGPFDLGVVVVRSPAYVDPVTAVVTVKTAPIPTILQGIPLDVRSIEAKVDRDRFMLNPTSCEPKQLGTTALGLDSEASLSSYFQASECDQLGFKPSLKLSFKGGTRRTKHPALKSVLTFPTEGRFANIASAAVTLPHSEIIDPLHVGKPCTRPQFAEGACPKISILGRAKAWTPLLDEPLEGNVYFRSNGGERTLPDVVADLNGQIHVVLVGAVDTVSPKTNARIRTTFFQVPDAPVSRFELQLKGGKEGLLVNSENLCKANERAVVSFTAQNGLTQKTQPKIGNQCGKRRKKGKGASRHPREALQHLLEPRLGW
jgi:hypothetical protein